MFIVPISGVVLFLGLLFISLGSLFGPLAWVVGLFLQFSLAIFIKIVALFSRVPFGYFYVPDVPLFAVVMYYVLFFVILYRKRLKLTWPKIVTILLIILNIFLWRASFQKEDTLTATFLDLKNDDTVFIEFPDGKTVLVNSGIANGRFYNEADRTVVPFIFSRGRGSVDILVLTNSDSSYISSASALLKKIRVSYFISPDLTISSKHIRWVRLKNGLKIKGIAGAEILIKGQSALEIRYKDAHIIISPAKNYFYLDQRPKEGIEVGPDNETGAVKLITDGASYSIERFL
jgi:competence protein ComEC